MKKRLAALLLVVAMITTYMPILSFAEDEVVTQKSGKTKSEVVTEESARGTTKEKAKETNTNKKVEVSSEADLEVVALNEEKKEEAVETEKEVSSETCVVFHNEMNSFKVGKCGDKSGRYINEPTQPCKDGYIFDGWYYRCPKGGAEILVDWLDWFGWTSWGSDFSYGGKTDCNDWKRVDFRDGRAHFGDHDYTDCYARWRRDDCKQTYTIHFDASGGTGQMADMIMYIGKSKNLTLNKFTYEGKEFIGWSLVKDGEVVFADGASVKNLACKGKTVTLYACWKDLEKDEYAVTYDSNIPEGLDVLDVELNYTTDNYKDGCYTIPDNAYPVVKIDGRTLSLDEVKKVFAGWEYNGTVYQPGETICGLCGDITLKACWNIYSVEYKDTEGSNADEVITTPYTFVLGGLGLGGIGLDLPQITKDGYKFLGWYDANGNLVTDSNNLEALAKCGKIKLWARWEKINHYTVRFYDLTELWSEKTDYESGDKLILPAKNPTRKGFKFKGWIDWEGNPVNMIVTEDATYFAEWELDIDDIIDEFSDFINTGDHNDMIPFGITGILALGGIIAIVARRRKTN